MARNSVIHEGMTGNEFAIAEYIPSMAVGMGAYGRALLLALAAVSGGNVRLVTSDVPNSDAPTLDTLSRAGVAVYRLSPFRTTGSRLARLFRSYVLAYRDLISYVRCTRPAIVHLHFGPYLTDWVVPLLVRRKCRVVLTAHDPIPHRWSLPRRLRKLERWLLGARYRRFDTIIVHSRVGATILSEQFGVPTSRVRIIPHGADIEQLRVYTAAPRTRTFVVLGQLRRNKRVVETIRAFQNVPAARRAGWRLIVRGRPESAEYGTAMREAAGADSEAVDVQFGVVSDQEFDRLLSNAAYTVVAYEGFWSMSGVLLRAMAMGTIPIIRNGTSLDEQVPNSLAKWGVDSDAGFTRAMEAAIERFGSTEYERTRHDVVEHAHRYDWRVVAAAHMAVFNDLANDGRIPMSVLGRT